MELQDLLRKVQHIRLTTRLMMDRPLAGEFASAQRGTGMEFEQVRPYHPGDDVRNIDWNVSARMQDTYVKEFRQQKELNLLLLVDFSASGWYGQGEQIKRYVAFELAALLAFSAMRAQHRTGLVAYTDQPELYIKPGTGKKHMVHMLQQMVTHVPQHKGTSLQAALDLTLRLQRSKSLIVVISDFLDSSYEQAVKRALQRHEVVFIRLYHPAESLQEMPGLVPLADIEHAGYGWSLRSRFARRTDQPDAFKQLHRQLQQQSNTLGIRYLALDISQDYAARLSSFFAAAR
jgi:uncharacterized protein (DUF58 family)